MASVGRVRSPDSVSSDREDVVELEFKSGKFPGSKRVVAPEGVGRCQGATETAVPSRRAAAAAAGTTLRAPPSAPLGVRPAPRDSGSGTAAAPRRRSAATVCLSPARRAAPVR